MRRGLSIGPLRRKPNTGASAGLPCPSGRYQNATLTSLSLRGCALEPWAGLELCRALAGHTALRHLNLANNKLGGVIPDEIAAFKTLTELQLWDMGLEGEFCVSPVIRESSRACVRRHHPGVNRQPREFAVPVPLRKRVDGCVRFASRTRVYTQRISA